MKRRFALAIGGMFTSSSTLQARPTDAPNSSSLQVLLVEHDIRPPSLDPEVEIKLRQICETILSDVKPSDDGIEDTRMKPDILLEEDAGFNDTLSRVHVSLLGSMARSKEVDNKSAATDPEDILEGRARSNTSGTQVYTAAPPPSSDLTHTTTMSYHEDSRKTGDEALSRPPISFRMASGSTTSTRCTSSSEAPRPPSTSMTSTNTSPVLPSKPTYGFENEILQQVREGEQGPDVLKKDENKILMMPANTRISESIVPLLVTKDFTYVKTSPRPTLWQPASRTLILGDDIEDGKDLDSEELSHSLVQQTAFGAGRWRTWDSLWRPTEALSRASSSYTPNKAALWTERGHPDQSQGAAELVELETEALSTRYLDSAELRRDGGIATRYWPKSMPVAGKSTASEVSSEPYIDTGHEETIGHKSMDQSARADLAMGPQDSKKSQIYELGVLQSTIPDPPENATEKPKQSEFDADQVVQEESAGATTRDRNISETLPFAVASPRAISGSSSIYTNGQTLSEKPSTDGMKASSNIQAQPSPLYWPTLTPYATDLVQQNTPQADGAKHSDDQTVLVKDFWQPPARHTDASWLSRSAPIRGISSIPSSPRATPSIPPRGNTNTYRSSNHDQSQSMPPRRGSGRTRILEQQYPHRGRSIPSFGKIPEEPSPPSTEATQREVQPQRQTPIDKQQKQGPIYNEIYHNTRMSDSSQPTAMNVTAPVPPSLDNTPTPSTQNMNNASNLSNSTLTSNRISFTPSLPTPDAASKRSSGTWRHSSSSSSGVSVPQRTVAERRGIAKLLGRLGGGDMPVRKRPMALPARNTMRREWRDEDEEDVDFEYEVCAAPVVGY